LIRAPLTKALYIKEPAVHIDRRIQPTDNLFFLGSCFSDEISKKTINSGLRSYSNPFGTLFHPEAIRNALINVLGSNEDISDLFQRDDVWLTWSASSKLFAFNRQELQQKLIAVKKESLHRLSQANYLFITFGSAWGYRSKENGNVVANCHKMPSSLFTKELTDLDLMKEQWDEILTQLRNAYPSLLICLTISPVRHIRDGLVENQRSKSRLIELVHHLTKQNRVTYFPVYELLMDVYRDYRFFAEDMVHPNGLGVEQVWDYLRRYCMEPSTRDMVHEIEQFRLLEAHRIRIHGGTDEMRWQQVKNKKRVDLQSRYPHLNELI
jgi:hypothetical protein